MSILFDIIIITASLILFYFLCRSFRNNPFAYRNIAMTSVIILLIALITGRAVYSGLPEGDGISLMELTVSFIWKFSRILLIPICFLCLLLCISNAVLLKKEGFRKSNFLGLIFSAAYLIMINCLWYPLISAPEIAGRVQIFFRLLLCYAECTVLSICIIGYAVLRIQPSYDKDFVVILGCSISRKGKVRPLLKGRVNRAIRFAWEQEIRTGKPVKYVPSGGQGSDEPMSEGSAMELYLLSHSAEDYEVFPEKKSKNTKENLVFSKKIIDGQKKDAKVMIVTTNFHVLRSGMLAKRAGMTGAQAIGSGTRWYFWPNAFLREMIAILLMSAGVHLTAAAVFLGICLCVL